MFQSSPLEQRILIDEVADSHRGKKAQPLSPIIQNHVPEIREIPKHTSSFNFEHEIQKIRIPVPFTELIKHENSKSASLTF
jgi:hypothetical protein